MRALDLKGLDHPTFIFIRPTDRRINNSVAWLVECKVCGSEQLVGSSQVKRGTHATCVQCHGEKELDRRRPSYGVDA